MTKRDRLSYLVTHNKFNYSNLQYKLHSSVAGDGDEVCCIIEVGTCWIIHGVAYRSMNHYHVG